MLPRLSRHGADPHAGREKVGGLAPDDVDVVALPHGEIAVALDLEQLALDHPQRHVREQAQDAQVVLREGHRHRLRVEEVAEEHGDVVAPARVHGEPAAAQVRVVDDVVVNERGGMDELDDGRVEDRAVALVACQTGGHQQHGGTNPLAAARLDVLPDLGDELHLRLDVADELAVHLLEVGADRLEDLRQGERRFFHSLRLETLSRPEQGVKVRRRALGQVAVRHLVDVGHAKVHEARHRVPGLVVDDRDVRLVGRGATSRVHDQPRVGELDHARVLLQHDLAAEDIGVEGAGPSNASHGDELSDEEAPFQCPMRCQDTLRDSPTLTPSRPWRSPMVTELPAAPSRRQPACRFSALAMRQRWVSHDRRPDRRPDKPLRSMRAVPSRRYRPQQAGLLRGGY